MARSSGGKSSGRWRTFTPMPATMESIVPVSASTVSSVRMPQSFFVPRTRSLVHLMPGCTPQRSSARQTATATCAVTVMAAVAAHAGRRSIDR